MSKIAFIGAGNMARAIIIGLVNSGTMPENIIVANPSPEKRLSLANEFGVQQTSDNIEAANFADVIILSVKPHLIHLVCQQIANNIKVSTKLFISLAAGRTIEQVQRSLSDNAPIVRAMPNTPSQLGLGMTGLFASSEVSHNQKNIAEKLMRAVGKIIWLKNESQINDIICVAGSAPAYFFLFMEAMEKQAQLLGFSPEESRMLVQQTAIGSAKMVEENDVAISILRENVTSKGGTTYAALEQFRHDGLESIVKRAMDAALHRAEEMAKED